MRCGITNHHLIAHSLISISAKNYQNQLICVEFIVQHQYHVLRHSVLRVSLLQLLVQLTPSRLLYCTNKLLT